MAGPVRRSTRKSAKKRICTPCGQEIDSRGYIEHHRACEAKNRPSGEAKNRLLSRKIEHGESSVISWTDYIVNDHWQLWHWEMVFCQLKAVHTMPTDLILKLGMRIGVSVIPFIPADLTILLRKGHYNSPEPANPPSRPPTPDFPGMLKEHNFFHPLIHL